MARDYFVYIMASGKNGTLYVGVTGALGRRVGQHKEGAADGFTKRYSVGRLVYYERFSRVMDAIRCEKRIKKWRRAWKLRMIEEINPEWRDLSGDILV